MRITRPVFLLIVSYELLLGSSDDVPLDVRLQINEKGTITGHADNKITVIIGIIHGIHQCFLIYNVKLYMLAEIIEIRLYQRD